MIPDLPLFISQNLLRSFNTEVQLQNAERIPQTNALLVVSNHRSFLDAPLLMAALGRSVRICCHHYMTRVPVLRDVISTLGCLPLDAPGQRRQIFFEKAVQSLQRHQPIGIFPEGAQPMVKVTSPQDLSRFHRGFAHLALRVPVPKLAILPVGISSLSETIAPLAPLKMFNWIDPSEPLFDQPGWHPTVHYHRVNFAIGHPIWITANERQQYQGRQAARLARDITQACHAEIASLIQAT